ncbi:dihydrofolate reductase [Micrococcales bacterium 31B]|nr:dihydrofolate reductase [Micrococcales bacterium 31B]
MSDFIYDSAVSLNGFIADEQHGLDWLFAVEGAEQPDPDLYPAGASVLVMGAHTYEWLLRHEGVLEEPQKWLDMHGSKPSFVFTSRDLPRPAGADVRFVRGGVAQHLAAIREAAGDGDVWVMGGGDLAAQFADAGALDRLCLTLAPVTLAGGAPVFPRALDASVLQLVEARPAGPFARLVYRVRR